jgi:hypothetical protein
VVVRSPSAKASGRISKQRRLSGWVLLLLNRNGIHHFDDARSLHRNRLGDTAIETIVDLAIEIHDAIDRLHFDGMRRTKFGVLIEERTHIGRDRGIGAASAVSALTVGCTSRHGGRKREKNNYCTKRAM